MGATMYNLIKEFLVLSLVVIPIMYIIHRRNK